MRRRADVVGAEDARRAAAVAIDPTRSIWPRFPSYDKCHARRVLSATNRRRVERATRERRGAGVGARRKRRVRSGACGRARRGVPSEEARERVRLQRNTRAPWHRKAHAPSRVVVRGSIDESKPPMIDPKSEKSHRDGPHEATVARFREVIGSEPPARKVTS